MHCPALTELPPPPLNKIGWPWTEESPQLPDMMPDGSPWPLFSIVTPSFNQGRFLEATIRSVLLQGYPNLEYVIIDGDSTDSSLEIIKKYAPWLAYWISESDRGQSHAINKGFERCTGEIITFQNSDDIYLPAAFGEVARLWAQDEERETLGAIVGGFFYINEKGQQVSPLFPPRLPGSAPVDLSLGQAYRLHQVSTFYTRHSLDAVNRKVREDFHYTMDRELLYRVCCRYRVITTDKPFGAFRRHTASKSDAVILPFAEEFARTHLLFLSGERSQDRLRHRAARRHLAGGYLKLARLSKQFLPAVAAMFKALRYRPGLLLMRSYWARWLVVAGLRKPARRIREHKTSMGNQA